MFYVEDILLTGTSLATISALKQQLDVIFSIKDLGDTIFFLGLEISRDKHRILIHQRKYMMDILTNAEIAGCKPTIAPFLLAVNLIKIVGIELLDPSFYKWIVRRLFYLRLTRLDLSFPVH